MKTKLNKFQTELVELHNLLQKYKKTKTGKKYFACPICGYEKAYQICTCDEQPEIYCPKCKQTNEIDAATGEPI
ncbi:MAG: hypothetical protein LBS76_05045 [Mycoplasmataceae bacterium]|jgi:transcription elongation factor Elf1|nr:hypothetical protein [Mycoplasmataceae bacterium]